MNGMNVESKGMKVNMTETKVMITGERQKVRQKAVKEMQWTKVACRGCLNPVTSAGCTSVDIGASAKLELVDKFCYVGDMLSVDGDADAAVEARIRIGWNKLSQLVPLLTNKDISLIMRGWLYSSCVQGSMLHGTETWPLRKENVVALQRAEMRMVRWMCGIKLKDRFPSKELRETRYR